MFISRIQKVENDEVGYRLTVIAREKDKWTVFRRGYGLEEDTTNVIWSWEDVQAWMKANPDAEILKDYNEIEKIEIATRARGVEVFRANKGDVADWNANTPDIRKGRQDKYTVGWYYWWCQPGCLPDSDPYGPYSSERQAWLAVYDELGDEDVEEIYKAWKDSER
jgi:hypothetical protein